MYVDQGLFRREVIEARRGKWMGSIHVATPLSRWGLTVLAAALAATIVCFLVFGHYTRRSRVSGQLLPTTGLLVIDSHTTGSITRVDVQEGQHVHKGDALVEISGDMDSASLGNVRADISKRLRAQHARLESDLATQHQSGYELAQHLKHQLTLLRDQRAQVRSQLALQKQRVSNDQDLLDRIQPLGAKGYVSAFQVQQQRGQVLQDQTQTKVLMQQQISIEQKLDDAQQKLSQIPLDLTRQSNDTQRQLSTIDQQLAQNEAQRAVILRAPRDGMVSTLLAQPGQTVTDGESLLSILPNGSTLYAQLLVPSRAVGFIQPGGRVVLRYQAYPYQKFGQQYGRISAISRSALSPSEIAALTGAQARQPLYRVKVHLDRQDILAYGTYEPLKPGMALDADILMERRTLLEWVFEPLYGLIRHADAAGGAHG